MLTSVRKAHRDPEGRLKKMPVESEESWGRDGGCDGLRVFSAKINPKWRERGHVEGTWTLLWTSINELRDTYVEPVRMPILLASNTTFTENKGAVVLTCYTDELTLQWLFNGLQLQLTERMKLSEDHRNLTIDPVKREDAGNYQCEVFNPISSFASVPVELDVKSE
ncbi:carcinoembryonic antigen-related cell adhesion molecule 21-like isoform X2 [Phyllostomus hastatus]|uniref:carcinoembryonic antigen-related cell adhesion molecule 21-like isoform X2 n=1 Tax=Phyllostomus hastatus TaxID=9423 RepID=UPI001E681409|nr:carcinoembryonic antigen-related cell adhesion molecule 21-like isoform X2 [Phyllostomus hastatus]